MLPVAALSREPPCPGRAGHLGPRLGPRLGRPRHPSLCAKPHAWQVVAIGAGCVVKRRCREQFLEDLDQQDPGRSALRAEWAVKGEVVFEEASQDSGLVRVTSSGASNGGSWRRLRFNECTEQSVLLLDANNAPRYEALAFGYLKSLAALGAATLRALGQQSPKILVLGVGLGALPGWYSQHLHATVHAVDLDAAVLRAYQEVLRSAPPSAGGSLEVHCCDGAEFVARSAQEGQRYDLVVLDVFDGQGQVPEPFLTDDFGRDVGSIAAAVVANLTCPVPMWEDAHRFNAPSAGRLADALCKGFGTQAFSVRVAEGQNLILAATAHGAPPEEFLAQSARELALEGAFAFDPVRRVTFRRQDW